MSQKKSLTPSQDLITSPKMVPKILLMTTPWFTPLFSLFLFSAGVYNYVVVIVVVNLANNIDGAVSSFELCDWNFR
jgi:hypothetical protein